MSAAAPGTTAFGAAGGRRKRPQKALCAPPRCAAPGSRCRTFRRRPQRCQPMRRCYNNPRTSCLLRRTGSSWGWSQTGRPACATSASWRSSCCGEPRACGHNVTPVPLGLKVSGIRPVRACEPVRARPFGHSPRASVRFEFTPNAKRPRHATPDSGKHARQVRGQDGRWLPHFHGAQEFIDGADYQGALQRLR